MSEFDLELAEFKVAQECEAAVAEIAARLEASGRAFCRVCGDPIEEKRRKALPSASYCIDCAWELENL